MNGLDRAVRRRKSLNERLGLMKGLGCCGSTWGPRPSSTTTITVQEEEFHNTPAARPSMNLAVALAAERIYRAAGETDGGGGSPLINRPSSVTRVSLMRLLEETRDGGGDRGRERSEMEEGGGGVGVIDSVCCVCMGRKKGAALVPCGHTFCRVCSRELCLNRGFCPLCNTPIVQILDIFP